MHFHCFSSQLLLPNVVDFLSAIHHPGYETIHSCEVSVYLWEPFLLEQDPAYCCVLMLDPGELAPWFDEIEPGNIKKMVILTRNFHHIIQKILNNFLLNSLQVTRAHSPLAI